MKKILSIVLACVLLCGAAMADYYYAEEEDPMIFVRNPEGAIVWGEPRIGSEEWGKLPPSACLARLWGEYNDEFISFDFGGDAGYISWNDISYYPDGENEYPPLYVVRCEQWISVWEEPKVGSGRLTTLPLGTAIYDWVPYDCDFIWYEQDGVYGFVSWDYLNYWED